MSQFNIDEIEKRTLAGLKDFQRATVERVDYGKNTYCQRGNCEDGET